MEKRYRLILSLVCLSGMTNANFLAFWNSSAALPSNWTCISCDFEFDIWYNSYPMCNATAAGSTGGADQFLHRHSHTLNYSVSIPSSTSTAQIAAANGVNTASDSHKHNPTISSNKQNTTEPLFVDFKLISFTGIPAVIPQGVLIFFNSSTAPSGFTAVNGYNTRYPKATDGFGNIGGMNNHTHIGITSSSGTPTSNGVAVAGSKSVSSSTHTHTVPTINLTSSDNTPSFYDVQLIQANSNQPIPNGTIGMFDASVSNANWTQVTACDGRLFRLNSSFATTGGSNTHTHNNVTGLVTSTGAGVLRNLGAGSYASSSHTHTVNVTVNYASNFPHYVSVLVYAFQSNVTTPPDTEKPKLYIHEPRNMLYCTSTIPLNHTETDDTALSACWYNVNGGANVTLTCNVNTTFLVASTGNYTLNLFANDTAGNLNSTTQNFSVDLTNPSTIIYSPINQTYNQSNTTVYLNLSTSSDIALLIYAINGSNFTYTGNQDIIAGNGSNLLETFTYDFCNFSTYNNKYFTINQTIATPTPTPSPPANHTNLIARPWFKLAIEEEECHYFFPLNLFLCRLD